jgi:HSP20 family protein
MTNMVRWDPFSEFGSLRRAMDRVFDDFSPARTWRTNGEVSELTFPIDLYETGDSVVVKAVLPGINADEVDISVQGDALTIKGETKHQEEAKDGGWYRREIRYGAFSRTIPLPVRVDYNKADAHCKDGILTVKLPKAEEAIAKTIKVSAN